MENIKVQNGRGNPREVEDEVEELGRYIEDFLAFLPFPFCTVNILGIIVDINDALSDFTGYNKTEAVGKRVDILFADKKEAAALTKKILEQGNVKDQEIMLLTKNKDKIAVSLSASLRKDEKEEPIGYFLVFSDINALKKLQIELEERVKGRTEELERRTQELEDTRRALINMLEDVEDARLKAEEERSKTQAIITNFVDGILVLDKNNILILTNPKAEALFQFKEVEVIGKSITELDKFPSLKSLIELLIKNHPAKKNDTELRNISRKELEVRENLILEVSTFSIFRERGKLGTSIILHDVSREKLIERMKTEFVSLAAHQLRTPLSAIKWTLRMILDGDLGKITKEQEDFLNKTYQSNERMISLINDLLNVARIEEGRYLFKLVPVQVEELVRSTINIYKDEIKRKKITLDFQKPKIRLPKIQIDEEKIGLAIQNLIENALRYTNPGGRMTISLKGGIKEIELSVKDTGVGIPKEQQGRVFSKFFRGANVIRMEAEGSGLGLFITKNIIEAHGGRIWFNSEENKGAAFYFVLPLKKT